MKNTVAALPKLCHSQVNFCLFWLDYNYEAFKAIRKPLLVESRYRSLDRSIEDV